MNRSNGKYNSKPATGIIVTVCLLPAIALSTASAQDTIAVAYKDHGLEARADNVIQNVAYLDEWYESLYQLKTKSDRTINIIHIGDSHIQADYITHEVRKNFQLHFGNAGRGLVVPAKLAGTNQAFNIITSSTVAWKAKRCIYPDQPLPIGIGGITISTDQPNAKLEVYMNDLWLDYSFSSIVLFFQKDTTSYQFVVKDTANNTLGSTGNLAGDSCINYSRIKLMRSVAAMSLETLQTKPGQQQGTIFGMSLENENHGMRYHAIGVNGAKYAHYNAAALFAQQTAALSPDLFIISLGTNESLDYPYIDRNLSRNIDKLITSLRDYNPQAKFILVTPSDSFRKRNRANPGIAIVRNHILQYAAENGLAFWDMYKATGAAGAAQAWRTLGLLRADGIHFTKEGYTYQGNLLFKALMKGYNQYVSDRHR
jgi:lysophospholipase L1-like esterase